MADLTWFKVFAGEMFINMKKSEIVGMIVPFTDPSKYFVF